MKIRRPRRAAQGDAEPEDRKEDDDEVGIGVERLYRKHALRKNRGRFTISRSEYLLHSRKPAPEVCFL